MKRLIRHKKPFAVVLSIIVLVLAVCLVIWLNLSWRPDASSLPPDSGFYAYYAKAILNGQIPYRDLWDNKPPLGYYLNALALLIFGQTAWGVWWSSIVWIVGCIILLFFIIKRMFGSIAAGAASAILLVGLMNPQIFQGGNLMEVYSLAPQIGIIGITYLFFTKQRKVIYVVFVGALTTCALLIKQPTIMLGFSSLLLMATSSVREWKFREVFRTIFWFVAGFIGLLGVVAIYWLSVGALGKFIDEAFLQGFSYIGGSGGSLKGYFLNTLLNILPSLTIGILYLIAMITGGLFLLEKLYQFWLKPVLLKRISAIEWILLILLASIPVAGKLLSRHTYSGIFIAIAIFCIGLFFLVKFYRLQPKANQQVFSPIEWTWLISLVSLPLEIVMVSLGGRYFGHYFITMLPGLALAIAYPVWRLVEILKSKIAQNSLLAFGVYGVLVISTLVWGVASFVKDIPAPEYRNNIWAIFKGQIQLNDLEQYIVDTTRPADQVLVWHIHLGINFVTNRKAPTQVLYPLNLFIPPDEKNTKLAEYVDELEAQPPELIIVQRLSSISLPFVNEPIDQICKPWCTTEFEQAIQVPSIRREWLRFQQFFNAHYAEDARIYDWIVYRKLPTQ